MQGLDLVLFGGTSHEGTHQPFPALKGRSDEAAGLPSCRRHLLNVPCPGAPGSPSRLHVQALHRFPGLHPDRPGSALPFPAFAGGSTVVKALFLVLAPLALVSLWLAVFADMGTSLLVTANGLRLFRR